MPVSEEMLVSAVSVLSVNKKERVSSIEAAERIVAIGKGVKTKEELNLVAAFADCIGAELACTRPMVESGIMEARRQIGLSGRTVRPKLIFTIGISGAVQFAAGMNASECIIAVNSDKNAPIFNIAHYGLIGDLTEILPRLLAAVKEKKEAIR